MRPRSIRGASSVPPVEGVRVATGKTEASGISSAILYGVVFQNPVISAFGILDEDSNFYPPKKECLLRSAAVAEQPQQHQEQVDEVEIEPQRAHDRLAAGDGTVVHRAVHLLDVLRVVGGEPDEHEHADD